MRVEVKNYNVSTFVFCIFAKLSSFKKPNLRLRRAPVLQLWASKLGVKNCRFDMLIKNLQDKLTTRAINNIDSSQVSVSAGLEHPFFVFGRGWASCSPELSMTK